MSVLWLTLFLMTLTPENSGLLQKTLQNDSEASGQLVTNICALPYADKVKAAKEVVYKLRRSDLELAAQTADLILDCVAETEPPEPNDLVSQAKETRKPQSAPAEKKKTWRTRTQKKESEGPLSVMQLLANNLHGPEGATLEQKGQLSQALNSAILFYGVGILTMGSGVIIGVSSMLSSGIIVAYGTILRSGDMVAYGVGLGFGGLLYGGAAIGVGYVLTRFGHAQLE